MNKRHYLLFLLPVIILLMVLGASWLERELEEKSQNDIAMFSWESEYYSPEKREEMLSLLAENKIQTLYQHFSSTSTSKDVTSFLKLAQSKEIDVYAVMGDPSWALDPDGRKMIEKVHWAAEINENAGKARLKGIVLDVECYLTDEWQEEPQRIMASFVSGLKKTYAQAQEQGLRMVVCIPYYLDEPVVLNWLETLIADGCDELAVMNYLKRNETEHMTMEAALADQYGKDCRMIYELQSPEKEGVEEINTYYPDGIQMLRRSMYHVTEVFQGRVTFAFHEYNGWKEMMGYE